MISVLSPPTTAQRLVRLFSDRGLTAGNRIPAELELSDLLSVSRPVIREGLSVLEALGLLAVRKGSGRVLMPFDFGLALGVLGSYVTPKSKWLLDLLAIRQAVESSLLPMAAPRMTEEDYAKLEQVTAMMEAKAQRGEYFGDEDCQFHTLLYRGLDNQVLNGLLELFWKVYAQIDANDLAHSQRLEETASHHRRILQALQAGDVRKAQHHLNTHFYDTDYALSHHAEPAPG